MSYNKQKEDGEMVKTSITEYFFINFNQGIKVNLQPMIKPLIQSK